MSEFLPTFILDPPLIGELCDAGTVVLCCACGQRWTLEQWYPVLLLAFRCRIHATFTCDGRRHPN